LGGLYLQRHNYGNLAVTMKQQERRTASPPANQKLKKQSVNYGISTEEKILYLLGVIVIVCVSAFILSRYALISQYNYQIENTKEQITVVQEQNSTLQLKRDELSRRERILDIAQRELGMTSKDSTVHVLSH
jgi:cell division protein FtsL